MQIKTFIQKQRIWISNNQILIVIKIYGLLHNTENQPKYKKYPGFSDVIEKAIYDQTYDTAIKLVKTTNDNTTLRIKHISPEFDSDLKQAINPNNTTIVLQHGIHTDLSSWEPFGKKLQAGGFDSWLIEAKRGLDNVY